MSDPLEHEDEVRLWAELRPAKEGCHGSGEPLLLTARHNDYDELEVHFTLNGEARWLLLSEGQCRILQAFLEHNR